MKRLRSLLGGSRGKMVMARTREPDVEPVTLYKVLPVRTESTFDEHSPPDKDDTDRPVVIDEPLEDRRPLFDPEEEERASAIWSTSQDPAASNVASENHLNDTRAVTPVAEEADSGLSTLRSVTADPPLDPTFEDTPLPSISSEAASLRRRSSSATASLVDREDSLNSAIPVQESASLPRPPVPAGRTSKVKPERSVESLPPTLEKVRSKPRPSSEVLVERAGSVSASSESGIGSRNTWCSMESIDGSPKATTRGNLSSRRISEIKRQLGVDPTMARYHRMARGSSGSYNQLDDSPPPPAENLSRRQRSLSPRRASPPIPLPRSRVLSPEPRPKPRRHLSRQDMPVQSSTEEVDCLSDSTPVVSEGRRTSAPPLQQPKACDTEALSRGSVERASFTSCTGPPEQTFKVVFVGDAAVGKSSFIMRLSRGIFMPQLTSTLGVDFQTKNICIDNKNVSLQLWDTAGQERFRCITQSYFRKADGVMLMYDCTNEQSFLNVRQWMSDLEEAASRGIPIVLVSNKTDLREVARAQGKSVVEREAGEQISNEMKAIFAETSAKEGSNINEAVATLTRTMIQRAVPQDEDKLTLTEKSSKSFASKCCNKS